MSKSIKLKDNNYIDSSSIVHNRELLSEKINSMGGSISNQGTQINSIINRISGYGSQGTLTNDPDNLGIASGFYRYYGNFGGKIAESWWFIIHIAHYDPNGNYARQIVGNYFGNNLFSRIQTSGVWSDFKTILS